MSLHKPCAKDDSIAEESKKSASLNEANVHAQNRWNGNTVLALIFDYTIAWILHTSKYPIDLGKYFVAYAICYFLSIVPMLLLFFVAVVAAASVFAVYLPNIAHSHSFPVRIHMHTTHNSNYRLSNSDNDDVHDRQTT